MVASDIVNVKEPVRFWHLVPFLERTKMTKLERAIVFATEAHAGQKLKSGEPYILHPLHVMGKVESRAKVVAVLHDVVEDTAVTLELIDEHFGPTIAQAVDLLTKREGDDYEEYILRLHRNDLARAVKIEDIKHNLDLTRNLEVVSSVGKLNKYLWALRCLQSDLR